jgi:DNA polymerase III subunit delta'
MQFAKVKGQKKLINKVISAIDNGHIPHAMLICGKDGYGNLALALSIAQYISCTNKQHFQDKEILADSCDECSSCTKYKKMIHPDFHFVFPNTTTNKIDKNNDSSLFIAEFREFVLQKEGYCDLNKWYKYYGAGNKQGVINVRDANNIIKALTLKTYESKFKIMIIWNADKMNNEASDKILKILEEPYPNTVFILTTEHKDKILPTILSRVQQINLPPLSDQDIEEEIRRRDDSLSDEQVKTKVMLCEGNINKIEDIDGEKEKEFEDLFVKINQLAFTYKSKAKDISLFLDDYSKQSREDIKQFLNYFLKTVEKCYLYNMGVKTNYNPLMAMNEKFRNNYPKYITNNNLSNIYNVIEKAEKNIDRNANSKINLFSMIINLGCLLEKK